MSCKHLFGYRPLLSRTARNIFSLLSSTEIRHVLLLDTLQQTVLSLVHVYSQGSLDFSLHLSRPLRPKFGKSKHKKAEQTTDTGEKKS